MRRLALAIVRLGWTFGLLAIAGIPSPASAGVMEEIEKACDQIGNVSKLMTAAGTPGALGPAAQLAALTQLAGALEAALVAAVQDLDRELKIANGEAKLRQEALDRLDVASAQEALRIIDRDTEADKTRIRGEQQAIRGRRQTAADELSGLQRQLGEKQGELKAAQAVAWLYRDSKRIAALTAEVAAIGRQIDGKNAELKEMDEEIRLKDQFMLELDAAKEGKKAPFNATIARGKEFAAQLKAAQEKSRSLIAAKGTVALGAIPARACISGKIAALKGTPAADKRGDAGGDQGKSVDWTAVGNATGTFQGNDAPGGGGTAQPGQEQPSSYREPAGGGMGIVGKLPPVAWGGGMLVPPPPPPPAPGRGWAGPYGGDRGDPPKRSVAVAGAPPPGQTPHAKNPAAGAKSPAGPPPTAQTTPTTPQGLTSGQCPPPLCRELCTLSGGSACTTAECTPAEIDAASTRVGNTSSIDSKKLARVCYDNVMGRCSSPARSGGSCMGPGADKTCDARAKRLCGYRTTETEPTRSPYLLAAISTIGACEAGTDD